MISEEAPIFPNCLNRVIFIEKEEYILSYKHPLIKNYSTEFNLNIGKIYLSKKQPSQDGKFIQYSSEDNLSSKVTVNQNILNNDKYLIQKVVLILEGRFTQNETFKIEDNKTFKIIMKMKGGVNLIIFSCSLKMNFFSSYDDILLTVMRYFKKKVQLSEVEDTEISDKEKKSDVLAKKFSNLARDTEIEENEFLQGLCKVLNSKKEKIRSLQKELDGDDKINLSHSREESKTNSSTRKR
jgi:hypothetical protein